VAGTLRLTNKMIDIQLGLFLWRW